MPQRPLFLSALFHKRLSKTRLDGGTEEPCPQSTTQRLSAQPPAVYLRPPAVSLGMVGQLHPFHLAWKMSSNCFYRSNGKKTSARSTISSLPDDVSPSTSKKTVPSATQVIGDKMVVSGHKDARQDRRPSSTNSAVNPKSFPSASGSPSTRYAN